MDMGKVYHDSEGNECSILQVVKREPEWAASRIQEGEKAIEGNKWLTEQNENEFINGVASTLAYILDNGEAIPEEELQRIGGIILEQRGIKFCQDCEGKGEILQSDGSDSLGTIVKCESCQQL